MRKRKSLNIRDNYSMRDSLLLSLKETKIKLNDLKAEKIIIQNNFTEQGDLLIKEIETLTGYCELSKLNYLNLSHNRIEFIELNSFQNLNELQMLDLSFNRLYTIENHIL